MGFIVPPTPLGAPFKWDTGHLLEAREKEDVAEKTEIIFYYGTERLGHHSAHMKLWEADWDSPSHPN